MNTAVLPSGDTLAFAGTVGLGAAAAHEYPLRSQEKLRARIATVTAAPSALISTSWNGSRSASTGVPIAVLSDAASFTWSNSGARVRLVGFTTTNVLPFGVVARYQNRPSASHAGRPAVPLTNGLLVGARNRSARA